MRKNWITEIALAHGRDYITPEDVAEAKSKGADLCEIQQDVLAVLGETTSFGVEDWSLCAYCALEEEKK